MSSSAAGLVPQARLVSASLNIVSLESSWHHNYASLGWFSPPGARSEPHFPSIKPELVELTVALHGLAHDAASRVAFLADASGYADRFDLTAEQREALIALDTRAIVAMGAHPLVPFLANTQIERQRCSRARDTGKNDR